MLLVCAFADGLVAKRSDGMTDRELLELAAKAAGKSDYQWNQWHQAMVATPQLGMSDDVWCPIDDDGQALRLAVKLRMQIDILDRSIYALAMNGAKVCELDRADIGAAARRAVVRAAAEIGRTML
jgi:hypothetical protein